MLSTSQLRVAWSPACKLRPSYRFTFWNGVPVTVDGRLKDALTELDKILKRWGYRPKSGQTWGYNCRRITGGTGYSLHAYGISVDINSLANPYGKRLITDMPRQMVEEILALRTNSGKQVWGWGGNYRTNKDAMHFEIVCTPADLATGIRGSLASQPETNQYEEDWMYFAEAVKDGKSIDGKIWLVNGQDKTHVRSPEEWILYKTLPNIQKPNAVTPLSPGAINLLRTLEPTWIK